MGGNRELETSETAAYANCRAEMEAADRPARRERRPWMPDEWWAELTGVEPALPTRTFDDDLTLLGVTSTDVGNTRGGPRMR